jgi:hypothetical protein
MVLITFFSVGFCVRLQRLYTVAKLITSICKNKGLPELKNHAYSGYLFVLGENREGGGIILRQILGRQVVNFMKWAKLYFATRLIARNGQYI